MEFWIQEINGEIIVGPIINYTILGGPFYDLDEAKYEASMIVSERQLEKDKERE